MMDAKPRRCAGLSDLGLSVSAWPKLASNGSQRLVSVGRAQAAAAICLPRSVLCTRADFECRAALEGWRRGTGVRCRAETFVRSVLVLRIPDRAPAAGKTWFLVSGFLNLDQASTRCFRSQRELCDGQRTELRRLFALKNPRLCLNLCTTQSIF